MEEKNLGQQFVDMGNRIQVRRKELKIKQSELAERINISNNHMSSIESVHSNNISQNIIDKLRLCSKEDIELAYKFIELLVERNKNNLE